MEKQNEFEANDFILCNKCDDLLMVPSNTKQIICSKCENVMDFINISENNKFLSSKRAFKSLSKRIYKERAEKGYVYDSKQVAAQQAQKEYEQKQASVQQAAAAAQQAAAAEHLRRGRILAAAESSSACFACRLVSTSQQAYILHTLSECDGSPVFIDDPGMTKKEINRCNTLVLQMHKDLKAVSLAQKQISILIKKSKIRKEKEQQAAAQQAAAAEQQAAAAEQQAAVRKEQEKQEREASLWTLMETRQAASTLLLVPTDVRLDNTSTIKNNASNKLV